jgi:hypothetical protein
MRPYVRFVAAVVICAVGASISALELRPPTLAAFDRYIRETETRMAEEIEGRAPFLWIDRQPGNERTALLARLRRGEVLSASLDTRHGEQGVDKIEKIDKNVFGGLVHHWVGTVLLEGVPLDRAVALVQQYERYPEWFAPTIQRARVIRHSGDHFDVAMRTSAKKVIEVVIDADYGIDYRRVSAGRVFAKSVASKLFDVDAAGQPDERRRPVDDTAGFLWRLNSYCSFEQRAEGTYEQCESVSLTRGIPWGLGPIVRPLVTGIPRETLEFTLGRVREQLMKR